MGGIIPDGVVSSTRAGDGFYGVYIAKNDNNNVIGVKIQFIYDFSDSDTDNEFD